MKDPANQNVLIVDDEPEMRAALSETLKREGYRLDTAENGEEALNRIENETYDLVISDVKMPKLSGPDLLKCIKDIAPETRVVMITAYGTIDSAVETMKAGASDYLLKPFSADVLISTVNRALMNPAEPPPAMDNAATRSSSPAYRKIVTQNPKMKELLEFVENVAFSKSTFLITGETGTGKEMFARFIHGCSPRAEQPFMAVNCAALPEGLLETELFGHEKGAFTGADTRKEGKFELAHKGTLLLDEVTEMGLPLQAKLLRVLQEHEIDKVGGRQPIPVDVRIVATTNRDPRQLIEEKKFREDLYYRLNVIPLKLPPLRERPEDVPLLAEHFMKKHGRENQRPVKKIAEETQAFLKKYKWNGNVRELENVMERAVLMCPGETLEPAHLFLEDGPGGGNANSPALSGTIADMEKELIFQTLEELDGNKTRAAEKLGISVRTLRNKLTEYKGKDSP